MKKIFAMILAAGSMMIAVSCKGVFDENFTPNGETVYVTRTYSAGFGENTKTAIESSGKVVWEQGDVIRYYSKKEGEVKEYAIQKGAAHADLTLDVASTASFLTAAYGGTGLTGNLGTGVTIQGAIPAEQSGVFGDHHVAVTKTYEVTRESLTFHNLTSYIKFTLTRDDVARVVFKSNDATQLSGEGINVAFVTESEDIKTVSFTGSGSNSITINNGGAGTFFIATLPCVLAEGFQLDCFSADGTYLGSVITSKSLELRQNTVLNLGVLDSRLDMIRTDLSADGTANCYVVSAPGSYKFKADVKGGTSEALDGTPFRAEVLWESFGTDIQPEVGDIVSGVAYKDGYITFTASGKDGNAVIAVENRDEDILWSWHIWVCKDFDPAVTAQVYNNNAGTVMDRNLGATSATKGDVKALGLLYQWGRKDPFLGGELISYSSMYNQAKAKSTITWPSIVSSNSSNGTIDFVVKHPTTFVTSNSSNYDWHYTGSISTDNTRWNSSKGMYDPCPKGWRVPDGGSNGLWAKALGSSSSVFGGGPWDSTNKGMDFADKFSASSEVWYPASGYFYSSDGTLNHVGNYGHFWSCTPRGSSAYSLSFGHNGNVYPSVSYDRADGQSVRCVKEKTTPEPEPEAKDLSADGTANCYIVSKYGPCKFDATKKGHTSESVGTIASAEVLWESFGNDVQPTVGDIVKDVAVKNGIVSFTASGKDGNAVIAVKNAAGDILWSWHIWVCKEFDPAATAQVYNNNAGTVMDRNLGATSAKKGDVKALGLLYQWGRKDPFLSGQSISNSSSHDQTEAKSTITWPSTVSSNSSNGTIDYIVKHPTTFVTCNSNNMDWYYTGSSSTDNTRWNSGKGMYDPCPKGWKVPDGGSNGLWAKAFGTSSSWTTSSNWDSTNKGMDFGSTDKKLGSGEIWYPASGYLYSYDGTLSNVGGSGSYWSCTPDGSGAYYLYFDVTARVYPSGSSSRTLGRSVRCLQE